MSTSALPPRPRTDFSWVSTTRMICAVAELGEKPDIRLMEELLRRADVGDEAAVAAILNYTMSHVEEALARSPRPLIEEAHPESNPLWLAVVAGELRTPRAVDALLRVLRAASRSDHVASFAAAVALARIGGPAVDAVAELARSGEWWQRIWACAALGWNEDARAREALLAALSRERATLDAVVNAIADRRDPGAIPALLGALTTCEPDLRADIEEVIRDLHHGDRERPTDRDWRLRYLTDPDRGFIDTGWPAAAIIFREDDGTRPCLNPVPPVRGLDEILAGGGRPFGVRVDPDGNPVCSCCEARMWTYTGVLVCPATASQVARIQDRWLTRARDEARLEDLFDVFALLEADQEALWADRPPPPSPWDQDEVDPALAINWAWHGVAWLIEHGVDGVAEGRDRLWKESFRLVGVEALAGSAGDAAGRPSVN